MSVASFFPKLWAPALEVPYQKSLVYAQPGVADTRFQPMLQNSGDTVTINAIGAAHIKDHVRTEDLVYDEIDTTELKLIMDKEKYYGFNVSDVDAKQAAGDFQSAATEEHGRAMADVVDQDIATELKTGAGNKLGSKLVFDGASFFRPDVDQTTAWDIVRKLALELDKVSAPTSSRWVVVGPNFGSALIADRRVSFADAAGTDVVARSGLISAIPQLGLNIYQSTNVPVTAGRETIIAGVPGALAFASQLRTLEAFRNQARFGDVVRGLQVYGSKVIRPSGIVSIEADVKPGVIGSADAGTTDPVA